MFFTKLQKAICWVVGILGLLDPLFILFFLASSGYTVFYELHASLLHIAPEEILDIDEQEELDDIPHLFNVEDEAQVTPQETLHDLVTGHAWFAITTEAPDWYICPVYKLFLGKDEETSDKIVSSASLEFPQGLLSILQGEHPPSLEFFKTLPPPPPTPSWGVYALVLEKENIPPRLYIGSGTNSVGGVATRLRDYETEVRLPKLVKASLEEGFRIRHKGLLFLRLLMVAIEATFTFLFFAAKESLADGFWKTLP
ncbi:hypothetical protein BJ166DRAFT_619176 [Pestalotiopsis sp. NC0098]|nr:hypothetical protein BJ166DRAFT_619176 [Pestalotiopsis sp. NC0098]